MQNLDKTIDQAAATHLGQGGSYAVQTTEFDSTLLVKMPREEAREEWEICDKRFVGVDVWRAYESTFLLNSGFPISGTLKIIYDADSEYMVESKSLKLYLNSFDMCKMGTSIENSILRYKRQIQSDLENLLQTDVKVGFFSEIDLDHQEKLVRLFPEHKLIDMYTGFDEIIDYKGESFHMEYEKDTFSESNNLKGELLPVVGYYSNLLRSRCRHTKQKDSGSIYMTIRANKALKKESFLKQIVSLREVNEFHEFCAEKIFDVILKDENVKIRDLMIACLYSRRGGIDINPIRATSWDLIPEPMMSVEYLEEKTIMQ